jgi:4-hydroxy-3-methylbut-2-enyl diphosphate reductase
LVDVFYIIGGKHSSNSIKLLAVCQEQCGRSFLIETQDEINPDDLKGANRVGVTAGASTPNWLIDQVVNRLRQIGNSPNGNGLVDNLHQEPFRTCLEAG